MASLPGVPGISRRPGLRISRRGLLAGGSLGIAALATGCQPLLRRFLTRYDNSGFTPVSYGLADDGLCAPTAEALSGPYFVDDALLRRDVREGRPGADLRLRLAVVDTAGCLPISGARVEIWQCDALGVYSGYVDADPDRIPVALPDRPVAPRDGERFLRGAQITDSSGRVEFLTIVPGWYAPRVQHVHVRVIVGGRALLTAQLYFPDEMLDEVQQTEPYRQHGPSPFTRLNDVAIHDARGADGGWPKISREHGAWVGSLKLGVGV